MAYETLRYDVADGILTLTLNRPDQLNAFTVQMADDLEHAFLRASVDDQVRAIVVTGEGRAFCAGMDLSIEGNVFGLDENLQPTLSDMVDRIDEPEIARGVRDTGGRVTLAIFECSKPVIAAVNGPAVGLGCSLVALSDVVYIAEDAFLSDPHVQVGLVAADGGPLTWPLQMSLLLSKEYALTGARISAAKAVEFGLANHVVEDPLEAAIACARRIAGQPQQAVESTKRMLNMHLERAVLAVLDYANTAEDMSLQTDDLRDNIAKLTAAAER